MCLMGTEMLCHLFNAALAGTSSPEELHRLRGWVQENERHRKAWHHYKMMWHATHCGDYRQDHQKTLQARGSLLKYIRNHTS